MSLDVKIVEDWVLLLLCSLSGLYNGLKITLVYEKEILNFEKVVEVLRSNEQKKSARRTQTQRCLLLMKGKRELKRGARISPRAYQSLGHKKRQ